MYIHPYVLEQLSQRYKADMQERALVSRRPWRASTAGTSFAARGWNIRPNLRATAVRRPTGARHRYGRRWRSWRATAVSPGSN